MLTAKQEETFQKIKEGKLTASDRADFYYRLSNILKKDLKRLRDLSRLLNEIPESYLEKIDFGEAAIAAMKLTEDLVKRLDISPYYLDDANNKLPASRYYRVDVSDKLLGLTNTTLTMRITYEITEEEMVLFNRIIEHISILEDVYHKNESPQEILSLEEMKTRIALILKGRPYTASITGWEGDVSEETARNFIDGKTTKLPEINELVNLKKAGLKKTDY